MAPDIKVRVKSLVSGLNVWFTKRPLTAYMYMDERERERER